MSVRRKIALLVSEAEAEYQEQFINGFLSQSFKYDYDVCVLAMYQRYQVSAAREIGESSIYSLVEFSQFDAIVRMLSLMVHRIWIRICIFV